MFILLVIRQGFFYFIFFKCFYCNPDSVELSIFCLLSQSCNFKLTRVYLFRVKTGKQAFLVQPCTASACIIQFLSTGVKLDLSTLFTLLQMGFPWCTYADTWTTLMLYALPFDAFLLLKFKFLLPILVCFNRWPLYGNHLGLEFWFAGN